MIVTCCQIFAQFTLLLSRNYILINICYLNSSIILFYPSKCSNLFSNWNLLILPGTCTWTSCSRCLTSPTVVNSNFCEYTLIIHALILLLCEYTLIIHVVMQLLCKYIYTFLLFMYSCSCSRTYYLCIYVAAL